MDFWVTFVVVDTVTSQIPVHRILKKFKSDLKDNAKMQQIYYDFETLRTRYPYKNLCIMYFEYNEEPPQESKGE